MRIGIDIDGTLSKYDETVLSTAKEYGLVYNKPAYYLQEEFNISADIESKYWSKYFDDIVTRVDVKEDAANVIKKLHDLGHEIWIITGRSNIDLPLNKRELKIDDITKNWLSKNNIIYDKINMRICNKGRFCELYDVDLMIEDAPEQIELLNEYNISTIIMDASYNKNYDGVRAYNWLDIDKLIK